MMIVLVWVLIEFDVIVGKWSNVRGVGKFLKEKGLKGVNNFIVL